LNAAAIDAYPRADALFRNPTTGREACCARATSGQPMVVAPRREMNLRRLIGSP
jgi:hypothetical protein